MHAGLVASDGRKQHRLSFIKRKVQASPSSFGHSRIRRDSLIMRDLRADVRGRISRVTARRTRLGRVLRVGAALPRMLQWLGFDCGCMSSASDSATRPRVDAPLTEARRGRDDSRTDRHRVVLTLAIGMQTAREYEQDVETFVSMLIVAAAGEPSPEQAAARGLQVVRIGAAPVRKRAIEEMGTLSMTAVEVEVIGVPRDVLREALSPATLGRLGHLDDERSQFLGKHLVAPATVEPVWAGLQTASPPVGSSPDNWPHQPVRTVSGPPRTAELLSHTSPRRLTRTELEELTPETDRSIDGALFMTARGVLDDTAREELDEALESRSRQTRSPELDEALGRLNSSLRRGEQLQAAKALSWDVSRSPAAASDSSASPTLNDLYIRSPARPAASLDQSAFE